MSDSDLGKVIKRLRKERGLTQAALCGEEISRNLLSQIESGKVRPSLHTVSYLAERLGVPISLFFLSEQDREVLHERELFDEILRAWEAGEHRRVLDLCGRLSIYSTQIGYLHAESLYRVGYEAYLAADLGQAREYMKQAVSDAVHHPKVAAAAGEMLKRMEQLLHADPLRTLYYGDPLGETVHTAILQFAVSCTEAGTLLGIPEAIEQMSFEDGNARCLALAILYEARGQDSECRAAQIGIREAQLDPAAALYYYRMAEECCVRMSDYETAYKMAKKRTQLLAKLKKNQEDEGVNLN